MGKRYRVLGVEIKMAISAPVLEKKPRCERNNVVQSFICSREVEEGIKRVGAETIQDNVLHRKTQRSILYLKKLQETESDHQR